MPQRRTLWVGAFVVAAFIVGWCIGAPGRQAAAGPAQARVGLGSAAAVVLLGDGPPAKINHDNEMQVWYYAGATGSLQPRYHVNQGLVVKILTE